MSALGQKQTSHHVRVMSVIPLKVDIRQRVEHVCFVPRTDIGGYGANLAGNRFSRRSIILSSLLTSIVANCLCNSSIRCSASTLVRKSYSA